LNGGKNIAALGAFVGSGLSCSLLDHLRAIVEANRCASRLNPLEISRYLPTVPYSNLDSIVVATVILPLLESPRTLEELVIRSQQLRPYDLQTLQPVTPQSTQETIISTLTGLEYLGYIMLSING
jgi:hypothetical protein